MTNELLNNRILLSLYLMRASFTVPPCIVKTSWIKQLK